MSIIEQSKRFKIFYHATLGCDVHFFLLVRMAVVILHDEQVPAKRQITWSHEVRIVQAFIH